MMIVAQIIRFRGLIPCLAALLLLPAVAGAATTQPVPVFQNLMVDDGLPNDTVRDIIQDRRGFIWFATQGGLVRYDGRDMRTFLPAEDDPTSIAGRLISCLLEDARGRIWVGSIINGLCRYDPELEQFTRFSATSENQARVPATWIRNLSEDQQGRIWVATTGRRLYRVNSETGEAAEIIPGPHWPTSAELPDITDVMVDGRNQVWLTTRSGRVYVLDQEGRRLSVLDAPTARSHGGLLTEAEGLFEAEDGRIWIVGYGGLLEWNPGAGQLNAHVPDPVNLRSAANNLAKLAADRTGVLWLGGEKGLQRFDPGTGKFTLYEYDGDADISPVQGPVTSVTCDSSGMIWAGTWQGGLSRFEPGGSFFHVFDQDPDHPPNLHIDPVRDVLRDRDGTLWVATGTPNAIPYIGGLSRLAADGSSFDQIPLPGDDLFVVEKIAESPDQRLWVGTNKGLWVYHRGDGSFTQHRPDDPLLQRQRNTTVNALLPAEDGSLWIGSRNSGLWKLKPAGTLDRHYQPDPENPYSLGTRSVSCLFRDSSDRVWVGSDTAGMYLYRPESDDFQHFFEPLGLISSVKEILDAGDGKLWVASLAGLALFDPDSGLTVDTITTRDGLPNDRIGTMLRDGRGRLWLSTSRGLTLFNPEVRSIRIFDTVDGLPTNEAGFNFMLDQNGTAYLPTLKGLVHFRPDKFTPSRFQPPVVLTGMKLFDQPLRGGLGAPLPTNIASAETVALAHNQNVISFSFASLDYRRADLLRYRYRLRGYDADWRIPEGIPAVTYTNLPPGQYTFEVQGTNRDGVWSENTVSLALRVLHPWWASPVAYLLYGVAALILLVLLFRALLRRARTVEMLRLRKAEVEKLEELDRVKSRFFANISHEFRTPLTLIQGMLTRFRKGEAAGDEDYEMALRNTRRLHTLVEQLLDLARLEAGSLSLKWHYADVIGFVRAVSSPFAHVAETRGITFNTSVPEGQLPGWFDRNVVETIVANLLSNALRYAPDGERVDLRLQAGKEGPLSDRDRDRLTLEGVVLSQEITIEVANTGTSIPVEEQGQVFERFITAASTGLDGNVGSGIGLALVKELVDFMGGTAGVESDPGRETSFWVKLPLISSPVAEDASTSGTAEGKLQRSQALAETSVQPVVAPPAGETDDSEGARAQPLLLIVEDHADLRSFLAGELGNHYRIVTAADGTEGLEIAKNLVPDLVVSDVMMPRMDGFEMLTLLKQDPATDHVPVILLTARADAESRKEGLKTGADDYLSKPLDPEELRIRAANLIEQRLRLRQKYSNNLDQLPVGDLPLVSQDDRFLARVFRVVEEKMADEDFTVEDFTREVGLSRTQLHRKLKALTGHSASYIIRRQRLRRAARLLSSGYGNVADVAYSVGFKSTSHFAQNFKDEFGVAPSKYREEQNGEADGEA